MALLEHYKEFIRFYIEGRKAGKNAAQMAAELNMRPGTFRGRVYKLKALGVDLPPMVRGFYRQTIEQHAAELKAFANEVNKETTENDEQK